MPRWESTTREAGPEQLCLFDGLTVDVTALRMKRAALAGARRSRATVRAYASDWALFLGWCEAAGRCPLPASPDTVGLYCVQLVQHGLLPATVRRRVAAISQQHLAAGEASPAPQGGEVRELLAAIGRELGTAPRHAKAAVEVEDLRRMLLAIDGRARRGAYSWELSGGVVRAARDRALLLLGFASGLRRSELVRLDFDGVDVERAGLVVRVERSKTDQLGLGRELAVHRGRRVLTCPVRALLAWVERRGRWSGPLFCPVGRGGELERRRLAPRSVAAVVKLAAGRVGLDASEYGGHSLRAGCATAAAANGASDTAIMGRTGHRSAAMVGRYVRHGNLFAVDPLAGVL